MFQRAIGKGLSREGESLILGRGSDVTLGREVGDESADVLGDK